MTAVPDGAEALRTYQQAMRRGEAFHAVILDATIRGGMGGVATIERLRDLDPNVTAIICSGYSDEAALAEFLAYGFQAALAKPFTRHELANVLQRTMEPGTRNSTRCGLTFASSIQLGKESRDSAHIQALVTPDSLSFTVENN